MQNIEKSSVEYKQAIDIMHKVRAEFRLQCPTIHCIRTFSEARAHGRRLKFWGIGEGGGGLRPAGVQTLLSVQSKITDIRKRHREGLRMAGWNIDCNVFHSGNYGTLNVVFQLTKV